MNTLITTSLQLLRAIALSSLLLAPLHAAPQQNGGISEQQAVSIAQQQHPGKVLAVRRSGNNYRVKSLSDSGQVRIIVIDASSGKVISR
jgi:uncharacterized membrane protein YkoI